MIILDLNGVMFTNFILSPTQKINEDLIRHVTLNCIRSYLVKFRKEYGDLVIASDGSKYWRKDFFPYYKASRKTAREASTLDWNAIFKCMNMIRSELKEFFPYPLIEVPAAEADDIIATLVMESNYNVPKLILSVDKDFVQLQTLPNVKQFDPVRKKWVSHNNPSAYLTEHIIRGDSGDGVPNLLSADDVFVTKTRQKTITAKRLEEIVTRIETNNLDQLQRNYDRNKVLIDLKEIPESVKSDILNAYKEQQGKPRNKIFNYMVSKQMNNLLESISEF